MLVQEIFGQLSIVLLRYFLNVEVRVGLLPLLNSSTVAAVGIDDIKACDLQQITVNSVTFNTNSPLLLALTTIRRGIRGHVAGCEGLVSGFFDTNTINEFLFDCDVVHLVDCTQVRASCADIFTTSVTSATYNIHVRKKTNGVYLWTDRIRELAYPWKKSCGIHGAHVT
jgi:hypothetical protein